MTGGIIQIMGGAGIIQDTDGIMAGDKNYHVLKLPVSKWTKLFRG